MRFHLGLSLLAVALLQVPTLATVEGPNDPVRSSEKTITLTQSELKAMIAAEVQRQLHEIVDAQQKENYRRAVDAAFSTIQTVQSEIELYKIQHRDRGPTLAELQKNWGPLMSKTTEDGTISDAGTLGPYFRGPPVNPFLNNSQVGAAGDANSAVGWTYDQKTYTIRLVVPSTVPWPANSRDFIEVYDVGGENTRLRRERAGVSMVQTLRSQLMLYRIQHGDAAPTVAQLQNWDVLLEKTNSAGTTDGNANLGPYLTAPPANPFNGMTKVAAHGHADRNTGWTYDASTGELFIAIPQSIRAGMRDKEGTEPYTD